MTGDLQRFLAELRRRRVLRVVATYAVASFGALQGADVVVNALSLPRVLMTALVVLVIAGLPVSAVLAWIFDLTPEGVVRTPALGAAPPAEVPAPAAGAAAAKPGRSRLGLLLGGSALLLGLSGGLLWWQARGRPKLARDRVAVLPFTFRGAEQYGYLREGMVELVAAGLSGGGLHPVDPRVLLRQVERSGERDLDEEAGRALARRFGAGLYTLGSVLEVKDHLRINLSVLPAEGGAPLGEASAEGEAGALFGLAEELLRQLRPALIAAGRVAAGGMEALAQKTTTSLPALKAFLEGEQAMRHGEFSAALRALQKAVAEDPGFALAHYRLAVAASWAHEVALGRASLQRALQAKDKLPARQRRLFEAFSAFWKGQAREAEALYRGIVAETPEDAESWYQLGEVVYHNAPSQGRPVQEAREPFERALALDPDQLAPVNHLLEIARYSRDRAALQAMLDRVLKANPEQPFLQWERAWIAGDPKAVELEGKLKPVGLLLESKAVRVFFGEPAAPVLAEIGVQSHRPELTGKEKLTARAIYANALLIAGRRAEALRESDALEGEVDPALTGYGRALAATMAFLPHARAELEATRAGIPQVGEIPGKSPGGAQRIRDYLAGIIAASLHDAAGVARAVERLGASVDEDGSALGRDLALGVRARDAWEQGRPAEALALLEQRSGGLPVQAVGDLFQDGVSEGWLRAEALRALGRVAEAERWYASGESEGPFWLAPRALRRAEMLEKLGRRAEAIEQYRRGLELWRDADPDLQPLVTGAQARLAALVREPAPATPPVVQPGPPQAR